jgi:hypothetical protein
MNKRIIKKENSINSFTGNEIVNVPSNSMLLHPLTSTMTRNDSMNPMGLTKFNLQNNKLKITNKYKCENNNDKYKQYLYIPPISIQSKDVLTMYDIDTIDSLKTYVKENIESSNSITIIRIINSWIKNNIETLKNYNDGLEKILGYLVNRYFQDRNLFENKNISIKNFVDYWIDKNSNLPFNFDIIDDFNNYIKKKLGDKIISTI